MLTHRRAFLGALCVCAGAMLAPAVPAQAQDRALTIVVGSPAGGTTDTLARVIGQSMAKTLNRTVVIENRAGAGGNIAATYVARSRPDGNTLLMSFTGHTINATLYKNLGFDPVADFTPITMVARVPSVLIARKGLPFGDTAGLIEHAKQNPGKLTFAIGAQGSSLHLASEQFEHMAGVDILNVPYKGTSPALQDVMAGTVDLMFASTVNVLPHLGNDLVKPLGVSSAQPLPQFPGVPTLADTVPGFESSAWFGLFAPAGLPQATLDELYGAIEQAIQDPAYQERMKHEAATAAPMPPAEFAEFVKADIEHWAKIIEVSGTTLE
ncbi:tripartite tricarboxylate transporter substrate binding protein [Verticiella sediminum]|uniref:Tripartite tricarboxylate transporter substrate binding protein n=1 Tax=Verticiella sediminum TaxID=1247510 RepID=A0A556A7Z2_9BURK|nr:tripartite tricarboxylate transporter substrate binding protein [Verticiella sediminum]TSH89009.1 tripartite tricarboxylate transporter substrate binding protein [Verticiella sediminum]